LIKCFFSIFQPSIQVLCGNIYCAKEEVDPYKE